MDEFPPPQAVETRFYPQSGGHANSAAGDRAFSPDGPHSEPDAYGYDPREPAPTLAGNMCCRNDMLASGAFDQHAVEGHRDVLVYTTDPLEEDLTVIGPVQVELWAASASARDTDFTAKLLDAHGHAYAHNVSAGIVRARFRNSDYLESWIRPGALHDYTIHIGHTATMSRKGHRIRTGDQPLQLPALRPEPEHRNRIPGGCRARAGHQAGAARRFAPVPSSCCRWHGTPAYRRIQRLWDKPVGYRSRSLRPLLTQSAFFRAKSTQASSV